MEIRRHKQEETLFGEPLVKKIENKQIKKTR